MKRGALAALRTPAIGFTAALSIASARADGVAGAALQPAQCRPYPPGYHPAYPGKPPCNVAGGAFRGAARGAADGAIFGGYRITRFVKGKAAEMESGGSVFVGHDFRLRAGASLQCPTPVAAAPPAPPASPPIAATPTPPAEAPRAYTIIGVSCAEVLSATEDDRAAASMFCLGYLPYPLHIRTIDSSKTENLEAAALSYCAAHPNRAAVEAFARAYRER